MLNDVKSVNAVLVIILLFAAMIGAVFFFNNYVIEAGQMTDDERIELVAEELDLPVKHINPINNQAFDTINGTYIVTFGETDDATYFIRTITKE